MERSGVIEISICPEVLLLLKMGLGYGDAH